MTRDADNEDLGSLASIARLLPREVAPPPDLWERIAARLELRGGLDHLAASLPTQGDPPEKLWPRIQARIATRTRMGRAAYALAASVAVAAAVTVGVRFVERNDAGLERGSAAVVAADGADVGG